MKARKQISLEELFRLYPQLRLATQLEPGDRAGPTSPAEAAVGRPTSEPGCRNVSLAEA